MSELSVKLRDSVEGDVQFLFNSWLKSYRKSPHVNGVPNSIYYVEWHEVVKNILCNPSTKITIMCDDEDASNIIGYVAYSTDTDESNICFHYVYVKQTFRGLGLAKVLINDAMKNNQKKNVFYTHYHHNVRNLADNLGAKCYPMMIWSVYMKNSIDEVESD